VSGGGGPEKLTNNLKLSLSFVHVTPAAGAGVPASISATCKFERLV
jgi:hypothetical protein